MATPGTPFVTIPNLVNATSAGAKTELQADIDLIMAVIPNPALGRSAPHTDFDLIHPNTAIQLRAILTRMKAAIAAGA